MQQDFEKTFNELMTKVQTRFDQQNATLAEYEQFFARAKEFFPSCQGFVHQMSDGLLSVHQTMQEQSAMIEQSMVRQQELEKALQETSTQATVNEHSKSDAEQAFRVQAALTEKNLRDQLAQVEKELKDQRDQFASNEQSFKNQLMLVEREMKNLREQLASSEHEEVREPRSRAPSTRKPATPSKFEAAISSAREKAEPKKILIVDDAEINRILMGHFFKNAPVTLVFAGSGEQAVEKIAEHTFDLVLMDLQMKGMTGVDAIRSIRNSQPQYAKKTQIIAITNQSPTDEEKSETLSAGANEYLSKSMSRDALKERVFEYLFGENQISA